MEEETFICVSSGKSGGEFVRGQKDETSRNWWGIRILEGKWRGKSNSRPCKGPLQQSLCDAVLQSRRSDARFAAVQQTRLRQIFSPLPPLQERPSKVLSPFATDEAVDELPGSHRRSRLGPQ